MEQPKYGSNDGASAGNQVSRKGGKMPWWGWLIIAAIICAVVGIAKLAGR